MPITTDSQSFGFSQTTTKGVRVFETSSSTSLSSATNKIATAKLSTQTAQLKGTSIGGGVDILVGVDIKTAFSSSGTVGSSATNNFTLSATKADLESVQTITPTITFESSDGTVRTFARDMSGEVASAVFEFDEGAALAQTITLSALKRDGTTLTKTFEGTTIGHTNGDLVGSNVGFSIYDTGAATDEAKAEDAAANLGAAILSENGFGSTVSGNLMDVSFNVNSESDATANLGKVSLYQRVPGTAGNTAIAKSATSATGTVSITDFTKLNTGDKVNLIATDTNNYDFVNGDQSSVAGTWESTTSNAVTATNLMNVINTASGPSGDRFTATVATVTSYATATITITDFTELNGDGSAGSDNVNLVATDGTNYNFYCGDHSSVSGTWNASTDNDTTATSLMNVINTGSGPAGDRFTATVDGAVVTVTQAISGSAGDTTITLTDSGTAGMSKTNFTGGVDTGVVTITQATSGAAGNTTITLTDPLDGMSKVDFTGGIAFDDALSTVVPAAFTGGVDTTRSYASGTFNGAHSAYWAAYDLAALISDNANGAPGITAVATDGRIVCSHTDAGTTGNTAKISYNSTFNRITDILPVSLFSGAVDAVPCNLGYEQSFDGFTWTPTTEVIADIAADVVGLKLVSVTLPTAIAPYIRWVVNSNGGNLGSTTGILTVKHTAGG